MVSFGAGRPIEKMLQVVLYKYIVQKSVQIDIRGVLKKNIVGGKSGCCKSNRILPFLFLKES